MIVFLSLPNLNSLNIFIFPLLIFFMGVEWLGRENNYAIEKLFYKSKTIFRWSFYNYIIILLIIFGQKNSQEFIYFQF